LPRPTSQRLKTTLSIAVDYGIKGLEHRCPAAAGNAVYIVMGTRVREETMKRHVLGVSAACIAICLSGIVVHAQQNQFPLAAPMGVDSKAKEVALPGAVNQGPFDD